MPKKRATWRLPREKCVENTDLSSAIIFFSAAEAIEMNVGSLGWYQTYYIFYNECERHSFSNLSSVDTSRTGILWHAITFSKMINDYAYL